MLKSKANAKRNLFLTRNKLEIHNKSSFDVRYEVSVYEGQQILHIEKEAKLSAMGVGVGGGNKIDYSKAERMKVDKGEISKNGGVVNVTVEGNKRVVIKEEELNRNFGHFVTAPARRTERIKPVRELASSTFRHGRRVVSDAQLAALEV